jgi:hypothetical protein
VQPWIGPDTGPYHILGYLTVPGNCMPKGPIQDLVDLHRTINNVYRKLTRQAERQKELLLVAGGAMEDGSRIQEGNDGDIIRNDNPERAMMMAFGGPSQQNFAFFVDAIQRFSYIAGNLDMMGGLSPQAKTLGQDRMLEENATHTVSSMQDDTVNFTARVLGSLCWYWWHDPFKVMKVSHSLPGMPDMGVMGQVTPQMRMMGRFEDLDIRIDPYSMQHQTPAARLQTLNQLVTTIVMPMMQLMQAQGVSFDVNAYLQKVGKYADLPDLADLMTVVTPPETDSQTGGGGAPEGPGMPQNTTRTYNRVSSPGRTQKGNDMNLASTLMGANQGGASQNGTPQSVQ